MLALGAVIMLCAVAIIGAGYAAFANTATARTYNEGNSTTTGYMVLTPGGATENWDAITATTDDVSFSTYKYRPIVSEDPLTYGSSKVAYYMTGGAMGTGVAADYYVKVIESKDFNISNQTGAGVSAITFKALAKAAGDIGNTDFVYFLKVTSGSNVVYLTIDKTTEQSGDLTLTSEITNGNNANITVSVCIGYDPNCAIPDDHIGDVESDVGTGYTQAAVTDVTSAPAGFSNVSFAFGVSIQ